MYFLFKFEIVDLDKQWHCVYHGIKVTNIHVSGCMA